MERLLFNEDEVEILVELILKAQKEDLVGTYRASRLIKKLNSNSI